MRDGLTSQLWRSHFGQSGFHAPIPNGLYQGARLTGNLVFTAGQTALNSWGTLIHEGVVGESVNETHAGECAERCAINALAQAEILLPKGIESVTRAVKLTMFVASAADFRGLDEVADKASAVVNKVFARAAGHARTVVATASLPRNSPVELELILELAGGQD